MKTSLPAKIFIAFLLVCVVNIGMLVTASFFFSNRNFESYIRFKGMKTLAAFSRTLSDFYKKNGKWDKLSADPSLWKSMIEDKWPNDMKIIEGKLEDDFLGKEISIATEIVYSALPPAPSKGLFPNLTLFDIDKNQIAGEERNSKNLSVMAVEVDGDAVGWIGLKFGESLTHPLDNIYMKRQSRILFTIGGIVLFISVAFAFFLTRHLLSPIKRLLDATQSLGDRNFEVRLPVASRDELGTLAKSFNEMAEKLESYEKKQQQWLSDISHELRTPLSVLTGEIQALRDGIRKFDSDSLSSLNDEISQIVKIVNDLHFISLAESGTIPLDMNIIKPIPILSQAIFYFSNRMKKNGMHLDAGLEASAADLQINGDENRLMQLFTNLLENSLIHTDKPGMLTIHHRQSPDFLHIVFEDTGPGVQEQALPLLFDRLYRTDPSRSRKTGSSGLGLAICKTIVESHGGSIAADNSIMGGIRIEISLPVYIP